MRECYELAVNFHRRSQKLDFGGRGQKGRKARPKTKSEDEVLGEGMATSSPPSKESGRAL